jgi:hypothetical protein
VGPRWRAISRSTSTSSATSVSVKIESRSSTQESSLTLPGHAYEVSRAFAASLSDSGPPPWLTL